ncbi:MAG: FAD-dependent oxidoreductase [Alphaproteobacteria bacterium]|nr:FAD-dependent oxidoreductase [Alphaproteobacteria bacterium]
MSTLSRRDFAKFIAAGAAAGAAIGAPSVWAQGRTRGRVVVIGGGWGGATAAKKIRQMDRAIQVTLVEPSASFVTCPFSNYVIAGWRQINQITHNYNALASRHGVTVVRDTAQAIDGAAKRVRLAGGRTLNYDKLIVAPGIDFRWGAIEGYDERASEKMPHAWKAGPQTLLLRRQLEAMADGGLVIMTVPANPFRCPPGPYERAAQIAYYLKQRKPRSKILILDAKDAFSKQGLFQDGWQSQYPGMIEWVPLSRDGAVTKVMPNELTVETQLGEKHRGAVVNVIPPQFAGRIARDSGLANASGWCPVNPATFESTQAQNVHVIGDATIAGAMPKSGFAANSQGKLAALAVVNALNARPHAAPTFVNTCYSLIAPEYGISVADVFRVTDAGIVAAPNAGGVSPRQADAAFRRSEAQYALGWYASMTQDIWGA